MQTRHRVKRLDESLKSREIELVNLNDHGKIEIVNEIITDYAQSNAVEKNLEGNIILPLNQTSICETTHLPCILVGMYRNKIIKRYFKLLPVSIFK